jgi:predicted GIY-YIG superfamily endonuclease
MGERLMMDELTTNGQVGLLPSRYPASTEVKSVSTLPVLQQSIKATSVYKYYDRFGVLIYVGITSARRARQQQHNSDKAWWLLVASQQVEHFNTRDEARQREVELIQSFRPPFNKQHNPDYDEIRRAYIQLAQSSKLTLKDAGKIVKRFCLDGRLEMELMPVMTGDELSFLTLPIDHALAACMGNVYGALILAQPNGQPMGRLHGVTKGAVGARISTHQFKMPKGFEPVRAVGLLKFVSMKEPVIVSLRKVLLYVK